MFQFFFSFYHFLCNTMSPLEAYFSIMGLEMFSWIVLGWLRCSPKNLNDVIAIEHPIIWLPN